MTALKPDWMQQLDQGVQALEVERLHSQIVDLQAAILRYRNYAVGLEDKIQELAQESQRNLHGWHGADNTIEQLRRRQASVVAIETRELVEATLKHLAGTQAVENALQHAGKV